MDARGEVLLLPSISRIIILSLDIWEVAADRFGPLLGGGVMRSMMIRGRSGVRGGSL